MPRTTRVAPQIDYPEADGQPMAEADFQRDVLTYAIEALKRHVRQHDDVYVSGNLLIYYEEGNPRASVAPDVFVVFGVPGHMRRTYLLWQEGKAPDFVLEVTSRSTRRVDQGRKRDLYERLGVLEYWQYDPTADYLEPPLQGLVLSEGRYGESLALERVGGAWRALSPVLGLELCLDGGVLRFHDPLTDARLLSYQETEQARQASEQARQAEAHARQEAEDRLRESEQARQETAVRLAELEARLQALQPSPPPRQPERWAGEGRPC